MFHSFHMIWWSLAIIAMRCYGVYIARSHLKEIRLMKGYTIRELASRSGITREWIERIEKQDSPNLRIATICKLAAALDVRPEELITYEWITNKWALTGPGRSDTIDKNKCSIIGQAKGRLPTKHTPTSRQGYSMKYCALIILYPPVNYNSTGGEKRWKIKRWRR